MSRRSKAEVGVYEIRKLLRDDRFMRSLQLGDAPPPMVNEDSPLELRPPGIIDDEIAHARDEIVLGLHETLPGEAELLLAPEHGIFEVIRTEEQTHLLVDLP